MHMTLRPRIASWIENLPADGRYTFTRQNAENECIRRIFYCSAISAASPRKKKRIASPRRGFYVLVSPEYRAAGSPPASWFIDDLMQQPFIPVGS